MCQPGHGKGQGTDLVGIDDVHDDATLQHFGQASLDVETIGFAVCPVCRTMAIDCALGAGVAHDVGSRNMYRVEDVLGKMGMGVRMGEM